MYNGPIIANDHFWYFCHSICNGKIDWFIPLCISFWCTHLHQTVFSGFQAFEQMRLFACSPRFSCYPDFFCFKLSLCIFFYNLIFPFQLQNSTFQIFLGIPKKFFYLHPVAVIDRIISKFYKRCLFILILKLEFHYFFRKHIS